MEIYVALNGSILISATFRASSQFSMSEQILIVTLAYCSSILARVICIFLLEIQYIGIHSPYIFGGKEPSQSYLAGNNATLP
jgi:hypothetical protein